MTEELPQTIEDAIQLVKTLGFKYLWVDSLCIANDNLDECNPLWQVMSLVYDRASFTIVVAHGDNADGGLPGLSGCMNIARRPSQPCEIVGGLKVGIQQPSLTEQISNCKWSTRAWTFQEGLVSRRCLIFTDEQIYWECRQAQYCEAVEEPFDAFPDMTVLPSFRFVLGSPFNGQAQFKDLYFRLVTVYSERQLSYESDALEAFAGVSKQFEIHFDVQFIQGIPKSSFDEHLLWNHDIPKRPHEAIRRRHELPSWSWGGWVGKVDFERYRERSRGNSLAVMLCVGEGRKRCSPPLYSSAGFSYTWSKDDPRILNCEARTAYFRARRLSYLDGRPSIHRMEAVHIELSSSAQPSICELFLDCIESQLRQYEGEIIQCMECGQFSHVDPPRWTVCFLIIKCIDRQLTERVGIGEMSLENFEAAKPMTRVFDLG